MICDTFLMISFLLKFDIPLKLLKIENFLQYSNKDFDKLPVSFLFQTILMLVHFGNFLHTYSRDLPRFFDQVASIKNKHFFTK